MKRASMKVGDTFKTKRCGVIEVTEYKSCKEVRVRFVNTGNVKVVRADNIFKGNVSDRDGLALADLSVGTVHPTTKHGNVQVLEYKGYDEILVLFLDTMEQKWTKGGYIRQGYLAPSKE